MSLPAAVSNEESSSRHRTTHPALTQPPPALNGFSFAHPFLLPAHPMGSIRFHGAEAQSSKLALEWSVPALRGTRVCKFFNGGATIEKSGDRYPSKKKVGSRRTQAGQPGI